MRKLSVFLALFPFLLFGGSSPQLISASPPLTLTNGLMAIPSATSSRNGYLLSTDWSTFNSKQSAGNYISALTGDVTASGPGSVAALVAKIQGTTVSGTTGSANVVFSASPTVTGTLTAAATNLSGNVLFGTDNSFDIGGPYPTADKRPSHIWAATAVIGGASGTTFLADQTIQVGLPISGASRSIVSASNQLSFQRGGSAVATMEYESTTDVGTITVQGTTAGFLTNSYQVPLNTQSHNTVALGSILDLSSGFSILSAGNLALVSGGVSILGVSSTGTTLAGSLGMKGSSSGTFTQTVPTAVTSYSVKWPGTQGAASTNLQNDGSGNLSWVAAGADVTLAAFGSTPSANAASLSGQVLTLQPADGTHPGGVSTGTQSLAGAKTFANTVTISTATGRDRQLIFGADNFSLSNPSNSSIFLGNIPPAINTSAQSNIGIGLLALNSATTAGNNVAIGESSGFSTLDGINHILIGKQAGYSLGSVQGDIFIGSNAGFSNNSSFNTYIGHQAGQTNTSANNSIILGANGELSSTSATNELQIGSSVNPIYQGYIGSGTTSSSLHSLTLNTTGATGSNISAAASVFNIAGAKGTGTGAGGSVVIQTAPAGGSGSSLNSLVNTLSVATAAVTSLVPIILTGSTSGTFTQSVPATVTSYGVIWPSAQGGASTVLTNDGSGNLSWASSGGGGANTTLSNLGTPTAINRALLFGTDNTFDIGGPYPTASGRPRVIWGATAVVAGATGNTYLQEGGFHQGLNSASAPLVWDIVGGELEFKVSNIPYVVIETNTLSDLGTIIVGQTSGDGVTAGFLTEAYQVAANTQAHNTVGLGCQLDLSTGFSVYAAGNAGIAVAGVVGFRVTTGGINTIGSSGLTPQHVLNTATATNGAGVGTLTNLPSGSSGNPTGYIQITINGSTRNIPYW